MRLTLVEQLVVTRKRKYAHYWREQSEWYWYWRLLGEVVELALSLLGLHKDTPPHELEQIASIAMNWQEKIIRR